MYSPVSGMACSFQRYAQGAAPCLRRKNPRRKQPSSIKRTHRVGGCHCFDWSCFKRQDCERIHTQVASRQRTDRTTIVDPGFGNKRFAEPYSTRKGPQSEPSLLIHQDVVACFCFECDSHLQATWSV